MVFVEFYLGVVFVTLASLGRERVGVALHRRRRYAFGFTMTPAYNLGFTPYGRVHGQCVHCPYCSSLLGTFSLSVNNTSTSQGPQLLTPNS